MAITNHERITRALELLKEGLRPFVERELKAHHGDNWAFEVKAVLNDTRLGAGKGDSLQDVAALLVLMDRQWGEVFRKTLGKAERRLVNELVAVRNRWAHQEPFSSDDAYRALDSAGRLLTAVSAPQAEEIEKMKMELLRVRFDEQVRGERRKSAGTAIESQATGGLKPWREVVSPHRDVASGRYQQAEFAADLWQAIRLSGQDALAVRAAKKLKNDELLVTSFAATRLRMELDRVPLWRGDHVAIRQLAEDFGRYLYLPRLRDSSVLLEAIRSGLALLTWEQDSFAYAKGHDEAAKRYGGLRGGQHISVTDGDPGLLVRPEMARRQIDTETVREPPAGRDIGTTPPPRPGPTPPVPAPPGPAEPAKPKRYHGTVTLDPARAGRDASRIAEEVITHLVGLVGSSVRVTLEIEAEIPDGVPENVVRIVTENGRTLKFSSQGFEVK